MPRTDDQQAVLRYSVGAAGLIAAASELTESDRRCVTGPAKSFVVDLQASAGDDRAVSG
jgi:proteasome assembly chaperone (PAC2) family protein